MQKTITWTKEQFNFPKKFETLSDVMQDGNGNHFIPLNRRAPLEVMTNVYSWDSDYMDFQVELQKRVNSAVTPSMDRDLFCGSDGFISEVNTLTTVAGYPQSPMSYLPMDNTQARKDLGLKATWASERHKAIVSEFFDIVFSCWYPTSIRAASMSTAGFPSFEYDVKYKIGVGNYIIENAEGALNAFANRDVVKLATEYGIVFCFNGGVRLQVDSIDKKRISYSLEYAAGLSTEVTYADKSVKIPRVGGVLEHRPDFTAMRARFINGAGFTVNVLPQMIASGTMKALFKRFPKTFHHVTIEEVAEDLNSRDDCCMTDVSDYDRTIGKFFFDAMYESMLKKWDVNLVDWVKLLMEAPYYTRPLEFDGKEATMFGDPLSLTSQIQAGNRSGHAMTSLVAKIMKVAESLCVMDDIMGDILGNVESVLLWNRPMAMKNNGDDEAMAGPYTAIAKYRLKRMQRGPRDEILNGYLSITLEKGQVFSGYYFGRGSEGVYPMRRAIATLEKMFVPERGIGTVFRKFWPIGMISRMNVIKHMPSHEEITRIYTETWDNSIVGKRAGPWSKLLSDGLRNMPSLGSGLTQADLEVLDDPDKLHHKYLEEDISPSVLAQIAGQIMSDDVTEVVKKYFKGDILNPLDFSTPKKAI